MPQSAEIAARSHLGVYVVDYVDSIALVLRNFTSPKNLQTSAGFEPTNLKSRDERVSMRPLSYNYSLYILPLEGTAPLIYDL